MTSKYMIWCFSFLIGLASMCNAGDLLPTEKNTIAVFQRCSPNAVFVHRLAKMYNDSWQAFEVPVGAGSGILWDKEGHVVTNYHVVKGASDFAVTLNKGKPVPATVVGVDPLKDIAVLKITDADALKSIDKLQALPVAKTSELQVGQMTIAIGNPYGLDRTLTTGTISALGRRLPGAGGVSIRDMIQTDASINPGNSGGPLLNSSGELIGMNTMIYSGSGASAGIGFAVPATDIERSVNQIIKTGRIVQPGFGFQRVPDSIAKELGIQGIIVAEVLPNGPAAKAGLIGITRNESGDIQIGDVIIKINDKAIKNYDDFYDALSELKIGENVKVDLVRSGKAKTISMITIDVNQPH